MPRPKRGAESSSKGTGGGRFELTPATIWLPMRPILSGYAEDAHSRPVLQMTGATSGTFTVDEGMKSGEEMSREYKRRHAEGDREAVLELLQISPAFVRQAWVREALDALERIGFFRHPRRRGRPRGMWAVARAVRTSLVALVDHRVAQEQCSREKVLAELAERGFENLGLESIRKSYYDTRRDPRLNPFLVASDDEKRIVSRQELEKELADGRLCGARDRGHHNASRAS